MSPIPIIKPILDYSPNHISERIQTRANITNITLYRKYDGENRGYVSTLVPLDQFPRGSKFLVYVSISLRVIRQHQVNCITSITSRERHAFTRYYFRQRLPRRRLIQTNMNCWAKARIKLTENFHPDATRCSVSRWYLPIIIVTVNRVTRF